MTSSIDRDITFINPTLLNSILYTIFNIIHRFTTYLLKTGTKEFFSISTRYTEIHLKGCISSACEQLCFGIKAPAIAYSLRTTMWVYDQRNFFTIKSYFRQCDISMNSHSITGFKSNWTHHCHILFFQLWHQIH
ncbi:hypothetical protein D3C87_1502450 [compost metagenome]